MATPPFSCFLQGSVLLRGWGWSPCAAPGRSARPCSCAAHRSPTGPGAGGGTLRPTVGLATQSQECPGEVSTVELGEQGHPEDCARRASDSCRGQPRRQCLPTCEAVATTSSGPAAARPSKERDLRARGLCQPFSAPTRRRGQTPTWVQTWHPYSSDMTLGKSISLNRFLHL